MSKKDRKPRKKLIKKHDLLFPISIEKLGTDEDPCFGKHYDPQASECQKCGDSELCAIVLGQMNHLKRAKVEEKGAFKDLEEDQIKPDADKKTIRKSIRNRIREMAKMGGKEGVDIDLVVNDIYASYGKDGFKKPGILKIAKKVVEKSSKITLTQNNKLRWN